jgi:hypothetical protein
VQTWHILFKRFVEVGSVTPRTAVFLVGTAEVGVAPPTQLHVGSSRVTGLTPPLDDVLPLLLPEPELLVPELLPLLPVLPLEPPDEPLVPPLDPLDPPLEPLDPPLEPLDPPLEPLDPPEDPLEPPLPPELPPELPFPFDGGDDVPQ